MLVAEVGQSSHLPPKNSTDRYSDFKFHGWFGKL